MQQQLVPRDLYGRTQHKTMQARLASDILENRSKSEFFRTGPGRFFLRSFQADTRLPARYRREYHAPLRAAQLGRFDVVAFSRDELAKLAEKTTSPFSLGKLSALSLRFARLFNVRRDAKTVPFRFLLMLIVNNRILIDNQRPPKTEGDIHSRSTIGIEGVVRREDLSLFSADSFGLLDAAARTLIERFELPNEARTEIDNNARWSQPFAVIETNRATQHADLLCSPSAPMA